MAVDTAMKANHDVEAAVDTIFEAGTGKFTATRVGGAARPVTEHTPRASFRPPRVAVDRDSPRALPIRRSCSPAPCA